ncbi:hypothetical protein [Lapidilactobacillus salsurivasis]
MPFRKAQSDAHSELTPNFAAQAAADIETCSPTQLPALSYASVPEAKYSFQNTG